MSAENKIDLAQVMLNHLLKHYTPEQTFPAKVLYLIASRNHQEPKSCANNMLRKLTAAGCVIRMDDAIDNKRGGSDKLLYKVTGKKNVDPAKNKVAEREIASTDKEECMTECCLTLHYVLNRIARGNRPLKTHKIGA